MVFGLLASKVIGPAKLLLTKPLVVAAIAAGAAGGGYGVYQWRQNRAVLFGEGEMTTASLLAKFDEVDVNHDGTLTAEELQEAIARGTGHAVDKRALEAMIKEADTDKNGVISRAEWIAIARRASQHDKVKMSPKA